MIRRFLIVQGPNQPTDVGFYAGLQSREMRETIMYDYFTLQRALWGTRDVFNSASAADRLESVHILEEGWTATLRGLRSLNGLPDVNTSIWNSRPLLEHIETVYNRGASREAFQVPSLA